jgi:HEPN domain-containing protein
MAVKKDLTLRRPPPDPRFARSEDRLSGRLEGRTALLPRDLLDPVVDYFKPQRVILFGSRARGTARRDSDIDLLVVVDDATPPEKLSSRAGYQAHRSRHAADVFPMRAATFERDRGIANTLAAEADADGIVVYGSPKGTCMKTPDPQARWNAVERWLRVAERDRRMVVAAIEEDPPLYDGAAFHCQQAVEKLLKGFLTLAGKRGGNTHSLEQLGSLAQQSFPDIAGLVAAASGWSDWVHVFRYPEENEPPEPGEAEIRAALDVIDRLAARLRQKQPQR